MENKGRGWHGDPEGHAHAGRKGGLAKRKTKKPEEKPEDQNA